MPPCRSLRVCFAATSTPLAFALASVLLFSSNANAGPGTPKPQESFAPYWTAETGWETELHMRNNLAKGSLTVTPILRLASGKEIPLNPVTISSNASASVMVSEALLKQAASLINQPGSFGSVAFRYMAIHARNLSAVSAVHMDDLRWL